MKVFKRTLIVSILVLSLVVVAGCGDQAGADEPDEPEEITLPDELPSEIQAWIENSQVKFGAQTKVYEEILYVLVTYGEKPTGGFEVEITDIEEKEDKILVTVKFTEPGKDEMVTQALTYPYDLAMLDDPGLPVEFIATGAETEIPVLE